MRTKVLVATDFSFRSNRNSDGCYELKIRSIQGRNRARHPELAIAARPSFGQKRVDFIYRSVSGQSGQAALLEEMVGL